MPSTPNTAIKVSNLTKVYHLYDHPQDRLKEALNPFKKSYHHDFYALNDVSFEIQKGETVGIIGKNGAGKSTLLKMITGVLTPTSGSIQIYGRVSSLLELGAGFNPDMTGLENIYLNGTLMGYSREEVDSKVDAVITFADIGEFIHQPVKTYSSGMYTRLAFAVAINVDPDILIVDEALSVGDMAFQAKCITAMDRIKNKGTTILFVSHDLGTVRSLCRRGIYISNGKVIAIGNASDIAERFMRDMRETLNEEQKQFTRASSTFATPKQTSQTANFEFKRSEEFDRKVAQFRYGSGGIKFTYAELLDMDDNPVIEAEFDQEVKLRLYLESNIDTKLSVNYYILDEKRNFIFGGAPRLFGHKLTNAAVHSKHMVEYKFKLPLHEGAYSIQIQATLPIVPNQVAEFADVIDDVVVFKVNERNRVRLWARVFVPSEYSETLL